MSILFYKRCRVYLNLKSIQPSKFCFQIDRGPIGRCYATFDSLERFETWYATLDANEKTLNEVIMSDKRKLVLDIDSPQNVHDFHMYDFERHVKSRIRYIFNTLYITPSPDILVYDMCDDNKLSYHIVVCNIVFSAATCFALCCLISHGQIWEPLVDKAVYKRIQHIRMEGSTKYGQKRWKTPTVPVLFHKGLLSVVYGLEDGNIDCKVETIGTNVNLQACISDLRDFKIRKHNGNIVFLDRLRPGMCMQCSRVHTNENAFLKYVNNDYIFICWRAAQNLRYATS